MDDVEITDVDDLPEMEKAPIKNQDLNFLSLSAEDLLSEYGWYLLAVTVLVYLLIQHLSKRRSRVPCSPPTQTPQDAVLVARRQEAMEAARRKMQEELDTKAAIFREKQTQQEQEKRRQKIEIWESMQQGKSHKGTTKHPQTTEETSSSTAVLKPKTDKKSLRSADYNPLTGQGGGSCSWRPGRRGPSSGG
ncbi:selenoprotein S isoform X1 [Scomber japonicus]|uniref:selenoprotein S isoform X1 n=1 Tax=Scomber japonicus TaxID=13676 RepID=UPI002304E973|nr:selenoprotein S isoform X1 [Scomber japonicus]